MNYFTHTHTKPPKNEEKKKSFFFFFLFDKTPKGIRGVQDESLELKSTQVKVGTTHSNRKKKKKKKMMKRKSDLKDEDFFKDALRTGMKAIHR